MEDINIDKYKITGTSELKDVPTFEDFGKTGKELKKALEHVSQELADFQDTLPERPALSD